MSVSRETPPEPRNPIGRWEFGLLLIIVLIGCALRLCFLDRLAVEHFDEGVYASNVWFGPEDHSQYPLQHLYAPPLLPTAIESLFLLIGRPSNLAAMSINLLAGCLMIVMVWRVGREWFGPLGGLWSATLCCTSPLHILLTRSCLTDALLALWLLAAVAALWRGMNEGRWGWTVLGGGLTSLAWWTKYNGWLPLAIVGAGWLLRSLPGKSQLDRHSVLRGLALWGLAAGVAFLGWLPCLVHLQTFGGYAEVLRNHRQYLVGWTGWLSSLREHGRDLLDLGGAVSLILPTTVVAVAILRMRSTWNSRGCLTGLTPGARLLLGWVIGLGILTPLYTPYPRVWLPLHVGLWFVVGAIVAGSDAAVGAKTENADSPRGVFRHQAIWLTLFTGVNVVACLMEPSLWQPRTGLADVARRALDDIRTDAGASSGDIALGVFGEPALQFQLHIAGAGYVRPIQNLAAARPGAVTPPSTYIVLGRRARESAGFDEEFRLSRGRLFLVKDYEWKPSSLVRTDDRGNERNSESESLQLFRVESPVVNR